MAESARGPELPDDPFEVKKPEFDPDGPLPQEFIEFAAQLGVSEDSIKRVHEIVKQTKAFTADTIALNGASLGQGMIRVAREYDVQIEHFNGDEGKGKSLVVIDAVEHGIQFQFLVDRDELARQLTADVPPAPLPPHIANGED
jgi:hypothetical protein